MNRITQNGSTSNIERIDLRQDGTGANPGYGFTGATGSSTGLIIATQCDNESSATVYTSAGGTIDSITTIGTYQTPTTGHCRLKEVDSTNEKGEYEVQFADARYAVSGAKLLRVTISGITGLLPRTYTVQLTAVNVNDGVRFGLSAIPNASAGANGGVPTVDANNNVHGLQTRTCSDASVIGTLTQAQVAQVSERVTGKVWYIGGGGMDDVAAPTLTVVGTAGTTTAYYQIVATNANGHTRGYTTNAGT